MHYFLQKFITVLRGILRGLFTKSQFYIKKGYKHRKEYLFFDDTQEFGDVYQKEVYEFAERLFKAYQFHKIVDIGCGNAEKLLKNFQTADTIGVEVSPTYEFLKSQYPQRKWIKAQENQLYNLEADMIICADVIEHLLNPDMLLQQILHIKKWQYLIISTPERNLIRGCNDWGPPKNPHHIREWDGWEFRQYIGQYFEIEQHQVTNFLHGTQMLVCKRKASSSKKL